MKYIYVIIFFIIFASPCISDEINDNDLKTIQDGDSYSAEIVLIKLQKLYKAEGEKPLAPYIPTISLRIIKVLDIYKEGLGEEGEFLGDLLRILSVAGDIRAKEALLRAMTSQVCGTIISKGLLRLGPQVLPDIVKYLDSDDNRIKMNTISTLYEMAEIDSAGTYFSEKDRININEKLLSLINDNNRHIKRRSVKAMGYFGDKSVIPLLEKVMTNDTYKTETGFYVIREEAKKAITRLKEQEK
ncbi:MAG: HEAT repeat domain-containing protein [Candidatus Latescibacterota bacterium]